MPNMAYVMSGELTVEKRETGQMRHLTQGMALAEMVNTDHRGFTGNVPAELLVFYAGTQDMPLSRQSDQ